MLPHEKRLRVVQILDLISDYCINRNKHFLTGMYLIEKIISWLDVSPVPLQFTLQYRRITVAVILTASLTVQACQLHFS